MTPSAIRDGFDMEGGSFRSDGGDSMQDARELFVNVDVAPNMKGLASAVRGRRVGTLFEDEVLRMPGLMLLIILRLDKTVSMIVVSIVSQNLLFRRFQLH